MPQPEKPSSDVSRRGDERRAVRPRQAREEDVAGIRGPDRARLLLAIERQRVRAERRIPEAVVESVPHRIGARRPRRGACRVAQQPGDQRRAAPRGVDVALELAERDRSVGEPAIGVKHRIVRVLPALVHEAFGRLPRVLDEAVGVEVAVALDPVDGGGDARPEGGDEVAVAGPLVVGRRQHDEERRRVVRAVVAPERNLAQRRHFARARLVQDLAGLCVALGIVVGRLRRGQIGEHAPRQLRRRPQALERGDDPIAAKRRAEPRHAGIRIGTGGRVGHHHRQIGHAPANPVVHVLVRRHDLAVLGATIGERVCACASGRSRTRRSAAGHPTRTRP